MLIPFKKLHSKYNLNIKGILHVGAHLLEEKEAYESRKVNKVLWIEGNPNIYQKIKNKVDGVNQKVLNYIISDKDNEEVVFHIANNGQSSSILEFGLHRESYPDISFIDSIPVRTKSLKSVFIENNIDPTEYNFINLDIQGVELKALRGLSELIKNVDYIYTEVNDRQVYQGNDLMEDIDTFLSQFGFKRLETIILQDQGWGDAFYSRKTPPSIVYKGLIDMKYTEDTTGKSIIYKLLRRILRMGK